jgi:dienelactone hydrolase
MVGSLNGSKKTVLIASDIYGISDAFLSLLGETGVSDITICVSPYQQDQSHFENEQQAYQCFQNYGGIDAYILKISDALQSNIDIKQVVGFSAGAAAIYQVMSHLFKNDIQLTLFYPSQIRYFLNKHPSCPCHIIFPESEPYFSLPDIIQVLKQQSALSELKVEQNTYQHGFMNKDSKAFNATAYNHYCQILKVLLTQKKTLSAYISVNNP